MRLKSFQAKSMPEAMRQVKEMLGDDAIIVSSREEKGGWVRVTAAVEQLPAQKSPPVHAEEEDPETIIEKITDILLRHRVPSSVSEKIISAAATRPEDDVAATLAAALAHTFSFKPLYAKKNKPVFLVGPPGAGKTLMTAKLAAEAVLNGKRPAVITTDIARAGGVEQLEAFLDILALPLLQANNAKALSTALASAKNAPQIIIDTGGLNPFDPPEMKELARLMAVDDMEPALVLPAGMDSEEAAEMAMTFGVLGVRKFMPTRLDFARRLGGLLSAADRADLVFTEASHTPQVANGIIRLTPEKLAELLMPREQKKKGTS